MVPDKKANVPYLIEAMIIYVIGSDLLNCKLVLLVFDYHNKKTYSDMDIQRYVTYL